MRDNSEQGFTLIEVLVTIALFSVISVGFYSVMFSTLRGSETAESAVRISEEARAGFNRMIRDTRESQRLTLTEPNAFGIRTDFNDDGLIQNPNSSGDYESLTYRLEADGRLTITTGTTPAVTATLIEGVVPPAGQTGIFSYSSNLLEYDTNNDGVTTCLELDQTAALGGDNDGCDNAEHPYISNVDFAFDVVDGRQRSSFFAQAQLRNSRD